VLLHGRLHPRAGLLGELAQSRDLLAQLLLGIGGALHGPGGLLALPFGAELVGGGLLGGLLGFGQLRRLSHGGGRDLSGQLRLLLGELSGQRRVPGRLLGLGAGCCASSAALPAAWRAACARWAACWAATSAA
jgi:hypothetical protein